MSLTKFSLLKRRHGLSHAQFLAHWQSTHVDVLVQQGRHKHYNRCYWQNDFQSSAPDPLFDGAAQMVPQSEQVLHSGLQQDPLYLRFVRPDEDLFLQPEQCLVLYCETHSLGQVPSTAQACKLMCLVQRQAGTAALDFAQAWTARAQQLLGSGQHAGLQGLRLHSTLPDGAKNMRSNQVLASTFSGIEEYFLQTPAQAQALLHHLQAHDSLLPIGALPLGHGSHAFVAQQHQVYGD